MRCNRANCSYIHLKLKSGKPLGSIGELMSNFEPNLLTFNKDQNVYELDDSKIEHVHVSGLDEMDEAGEETMFSADPLGFFSLGNLEKAPPPPKRGGNQGHLPSHGACCAWEFPASRWVLCGA